MKVSITYCGRWKYLPKASSLAAVIKTKVECTLELIEGSNGIFDVVANDVLIFSKHTENRFPEEQEILMALENISEN